MKIIRKHKLRVECPLCGTGWIEWVIAHTFKTECPFCHRGLDVKKAPVGSGRKILVGATQ